jgi:hypothetical protein
MAAALRPMRRRCRLGAVLALALLVLGSVVPAGPAAAVEPAVEPFLGTYVGTAQVYDRNGNLEETRDMDILIEEGPKGGFTITWINVSRVDGRRDVPGVERRVATATFVPGDRDGMYVEEMRGSLFERRQTADAMAGEPLRWARVDGDRLGIFSFGILDDGGYGLQSYERILTDVGIDIEFRAVRDNTVVRTIVGHTVRVD